MVATLLTGAAESNRGVLRWIPEVTWGTTPASGLVKTMRITSSTLEAKKSTKTSDEIRADRMVSNVIEVAAQTSGDVGWEMSAGGQDDFYEQFLLSSFTQSMNFFNVEGSSVSVNTTSKVRIAGKDWSAWLANSQYIKLEGFTNVNNNGYFKIASFAFTGGNTDITTVETTLVIEAGSTYTAVRDANDVFSKATTTQFQASNTVQTVAVLPTNLIVGQRVYLEGLGKETGTATFTATDPTENDKFTLTDGVQTLRFEIATNQATVSPGNVWIPLSATETTLAANFVTALMDQFRKQNIRISAVAAAAVVTMTNHRGTGGVLTEALATMTTTAFSGGSLTKFGFYTIASIVDTTHFTTVETLTVDTNATTLTVIIKGSHLRNPGDPTLIVKKSISAETGFTDIGKYLGHNGLRLGSFKTTIAPGDLVKGSFSFMGRQTTALDTSVLGLSPFVILETTTEEPMNATANVSNVLRNGLALTTAVLKIEIDGDAGLRVQPAVGAKFPAGIGYGRFNLKGSFTAYFQNFDLYRDFLNHTTASLEWSLEDADHNCYFFRVPSIKYLTDPLTLDGIDKDVTEMISWTAQRDTSLGTMFMIDKFSSTYPMTVA